MRRRQLVGLLGTAVVAWPLISRAQQPIVPVIGYLGFGSAVNSVSYLAAFRKGLIEEGFVEGQNVTIEYRWRANTIACPNWRPISCTGELRSSLHRVIRPPQFAP